MSGLETWRVTLLFKSGNRLEVETDVPPTGELTLSGLGLVDGGVLKAVDTGQLEAMAVEPAQPKRAATSTRPSRSQEERDQELSELLLEELVKPDHRVGVGIQRIQRLLHCGRGPAQRAIDRLVELDLAERTQQGVAVTAEGREQHRLHHEEPADRYDDMTHDEIVEAAVKSEPVADQPIAGHQSLVEARQADPRVPVVPQAPSVPLGAPGTVDRPLHYTDVPTPDVES